MGVWFLTSMEERLYKKGLYMFSASSLPFTLWYQYVSAWLCVAAGTGAMLFSVSCSVEKHMAEKTREVIREMDSLPSWDRLPRKEISWDQAWNIVMAQNLDLKRSEQSVKSAKRAVTAVFTQFIPGVNLDWMLTKELSELANVSGDDMEYNTNILFNMPSLTKIPFDYYSAKASEYTARKSVEMKKRELLSKLYRQVTLYQNALSNYRNQLKELPYDDDGTQRRKIEEGWEKSFSEISQGFAGLLGNMEAQWTVNPATMPRINWNSYKKAAKGLDVLMVTMVALELEASRLQVLNAKMNFFPSVDINFYSPSLFTRTGGTYEGFFAGGGDMQVNMSLREELDTRLTNWFQYKSAKENHEMMQKKVRMDLQLRRIKISALMESRRRFEVWKNVILKEIDFKKSRLSVSGEEYLEQREELRKMYADLDSETTKNADVEAALIMEYGWLR